MIDMLRIAQLRRWDKNPRPQVSPDKREDLKANIRERGVLMPLVVRPVQGEKDQFEVVAGDTRRDIVAELNAEGAWDDDREIPVMIRKDLVGDDAAALEVAVSENLHIPMHAMDQFTAFNSLVELGRSVTEIANAYGTSERVVEQRLSYAKLDARARQLVKDNERNLEWASAMTLASPEEQKEMLDEIETDPRRYLTVHDVRRRLENELVPTTLALFPLTGLDDKLVRKDLFDPEGTSYLPIGDFNELQDKALRDLVDARKAEGWSKVSVLNEREFDRYKYMDGVEDKTQAEVIFVRHSSGAVAEHAGLCLRPEERVNAIDSQEDEAAGDALFGRSTEEVRASVRKDPTYAEGRKTIAYLERNRALVAQSVLMNDQKLAMAVTVAGLLSAAAPKPVEGKTFDGLLDVDPENIARVAVERRLDASGQILAAAAVDPTGDYGEMVRQLYAMDDQALGTVFQVEMAKRVTTDLRRIADLYATVVEIDGRPLSELWRPDRSYLETLSKDQMVGLAGKILPSRVADRLTGQKDDVVETLHQVITDAHEGGMRLQHGEREIVTSWAPVLMGGVPMEAGSDPFGTEGEENGDEAGEALFDQAA